MTTYEKKERASVIDSLRELDKVLVESGGVFTGRAFEHGVIAILSMLDACTERIVDRLERRQ